MLRCIFMVCLMVSLSMSKPNFILFLTDDQDLLLDGMLPMTATIKNIANEGFTFSEAHVHSPICCPSRSSLLTGKYLHNLRVYNNSLSGNCSSRAWQTKQEPHSVAAILKQAGYVNFYAGKYLNQYGSSQAGGLQHIPLGYDWWYGLKGNSKYYNFTLSINGTARHFTKDYLTDLIKQYALDFLNLQSGPFFMILAPPASHAPFTPAERHRKAFIDVKTKKTPNFNVSAEDKHWLLQLPPRNLPGNIPTLDLIQRQRLQTLLAVDEMVDEVVTTLRQLGLVNNTYLLFTSDNGFHIGQFSMPWDKRQPYETDTHVPFLMSGPLIPKKQLFDKPISLVDVAPSILDLADIPIPVDMDGVSFISDLRNYTFIEYYGEGNEHSVEENCGFSIEDSKNLNECSLENWCKCQDSRNNTYSCVVNHSKGDKMKYCLFYDDLEFVESYNLKQDPYELRNLAKQLAPAEHQQYREIINNFRKCIGQGCAI